MVDVFISYSRKDRDAVAQLAQAVTAAGYDVWWDKELPPHKNYGDVITEKISEARAAIVVWSQDSVQSEWVRAEADFARGQKKLVQTALDQAMPPMPFNQIQYAQLGDWKGEDEHGGWSKVRASLAELCGGEQPLPARASPLPPPKPAPGATASRWPLWAGGGMLVLAAILFAANQLREPTVAVSGASALQTTAAPPALTAAPAATNPVPVASANLAPAVAPTTFAGKAPPQLFPLSSVRALNPRQFDGLSLQQLNRARNEIFAHAGRRFRDPKLLAYFSQYDWYRPQQFEVVLSPLQAHNMKLLNAAAEARQ
jgi:hypothetical protein